MKPQRFGFRGAYLAAVLLPSPGQPSRAAAHLCRAGAGSSPGSGNGGPGFDNALRLPAPLPLAVEAPPSVPASILSPQQRSRLNDAADCEFYATPRWKHHTDEAFRRQLTDLYRQRLRPGWRVLDLCSSAHSHLPPELPLGAVLGHGMNAAELAANPRLSRSWVQDLNQQQWLEGLEDGSLDAVLCASGIQYLQQPEAVLGEVLRVLRPGGLLILSFSTHCFAEKAFAAWLSCGSLGGQVQLVQQLLAAAGFPPGEVVLREPDTPAAASAAGGSSSRDPFAAVIAPKPSTQQPPAAQGTADPASAAHVPPALREMDAAAAAAAAGGAAAAAHDTPVSPATLDRWYWAYQQMVLDARELGIPASAIPQLPNDPSEAQLRAARDHLSGIIASFLSAGL